MAQTVIGIFDNRNNAEQAVERLVAQGYDRENIDLSMHSDERSYGSDRDSSNSGDGFGDKISRFFSNLFDDEDESSRYTTIARRGTVVTVQTDSSDLASRASEILDECGAIDVDEKSRSGSESYSSGAYASSDTDSNFGSSVSPGTPVAGIDSYDDKSRMELSSTDSDTRMDYSSRENLTDDVDNRSIPIIEEDLQVGKREVERGGVRIRSRIVERPVEESLRLREEHVTVDRTRTDRPATSADFDTFKEGEIEVRERSEVPVVNKEARVVEEVNLRKDVREREEVVRDTVRKTEVDVDNITESDTDSFTSTETKSSRRKKL